jgi:peptidyl-prolyl cis-trans isomerase D
MAKQRNVQIAESTYLANVESSNKVELTSGVAVKAKAIARNPLGYAKDNDKLATYKSGSLTASEFADWVAAYPPNSQIRPQLMNAPDSLVEKFVRQIVRNELVLGQADSAKAQLDTAELSNLYLNFKNAVTQTWTSLNVEPSKLADSAKAGGDKAKIAAARIESFFDKLIKNEVPFVDVPYPVARALQKKYDFGINDAGLDKVIEKAKTVRATADSLKAGKGAPAAPGAAAPAPDTTKK